MKFNKIFSIYLFLIGISAVLGGYNLVVNNGDDIPLDWLANTPFDSYFWPGIILAFVVGGTHIVTALVTWMKYKFASESAAIAGLGLLIWIFTEIYMIEKTHWLQILYFGLGIFTLVITIIFLRFKVINDKQITV